MKKYLLKQKIKSITPSTWIFIGVLAFFVILAIVLIIVGLHINGYSFSKFFTRFGAYIVICLVAILGIGVAFLLTNLRKGK